MELAIHQNLDEIFIEPIDADRYRVHLPIGMGSDVLSEKIGSSLTEDQLNQAIDLLSNDDGNRVFEHKGDYVLVRPLER
jgi:hypothetical protein